VVPTPQPPREPISPGLESLRFDARIDEQIARASRSQPAKATIQSFAKHPALEVSPILRIGFVNDLEGLPKLIKSTTTALVSKYESVDNLGKGMRKLEQANRALASDADLISVVAASGAIPELERLGQKLDGGALEQFARVDLPAAAKISSAQVGKLITITSKTGGVE